MIVTTVAVSANGEWIAFGCKQLGQLLVWEWRSEHYVLKQQGHAYDCSCVAYSPQGEFIATGGDDGKVKLWHPITGFCVSTFHPHTAPVSAICFSPRGGVLVSASLDGTVRLYDTRRYRNFRTLVAPDPVQFTSVAMDSSGDLVAAGSEDNFCVYVWSMQTGKLLEVLSGHEGPVSSISFSPINTTLISGSWDRTCRIWDVYEGKQRIESIMCNREVMAVAHSPDGKQCSIATNDGDIVVYDTVNNSVLGTINGRDDVWGGRTSDDVRDPINSSKGKTFKCISYSGDGALLLAGGDSKWLCLYEMSSRTLVKRFQLTVNRSLDGALDRLNSKNMTAGGDKTTWLVEDEWGSDDEKDRAKYAVMSIDDVMYRGDTTLPGATKGDFISRRVKLAIKTNGLAFSPSSRSYVAATTLGLLSWSLDDETTFDPFDLDVDVTPKTIKKCISKKEYTKAFAVCRWW